MRWLVCLFLLVSSFAHGELILQSGVPLQARQQHCPETHGVGNERRNLAISLSPPQGGSDLKMRMNVANPPFRKGEVLSGALIGQGGTPPYVYSIAAGSLPTGISLDSATGLLSGTPTVVGHNTFLARVQDAALGVYRCTFSLDIIPAFTVVAGTPTPAENGIAYSYQFLVSGATGAVTWALTGGAMPTGLSIDAAGLMSGIPAGFGPYSFTVTATDAGSGDSLDVHCSMNDYLGIGSASQIIGNTYIVGSFSDQILPSGSIPTGGVPPVKFSFTSLPSWVTAVTAHNADGFSGTRYPILSGAPDTAGAISIAYTMTDALGVTVTKSFDLNVLALSTNTALGTSDILFPSQNAVKAYVDAHAGGGYTGHIRAASATIASATKNRITANSVALTTPASPADFDDFLVTIESGAISSCQVTANAGQTVNGGASFAFAIVPCSFWFQYNFAATNWFVREYRIGDI